MAQPLKFTNARLREMREKGRTSLFFFQRGILQDPDLTDVHADLCAFLQGIPPYGPWLRAGVCGWRGCLKSSAEIAFLLWKGLYTPNWSALLVEQRSENAKFHHSKLQDKLRFGPSAALLQHMFCDPAIGEVRIPDGLAGSNSERTMLVRTDPLADPFLVHAGLESKLESLHKNLILGDDLEGADSDKSDVPNEESEKFVFNRAEALLKNPSKDQILVSGTPHGEKPLMWKIRRFKDDDPKDRKVWALWWKPVVDQEGKPYWPERYGQEWIDHRRRMAKMSSQARRLWDTQFMLREHSVGSQAFDMDRIRANAYDFKGGRLIRYQTTKFLSPVPAHRWEILEEQKPAHVDLAHCNRYLHVDPAHRAPEERRNEGGRPSAWGIIDVAVSHDFHVFPVHEWVEEGSLDQACEAFFRMYRRACPKVATFEAIGAQVWFRHQLRILERTKYRGLLSLPEPWATGVKRIANPSSRLEEVHKKNQEKESWILDQLEVPHNTGLLHLNERQTPKLWAQHEQFGVTNATIDGVDALAQGPSVWVPPISQSGMKERRFRDYVKKIRRMIEPSLDYARAWDEAS